MHRWHRVKLSLGGDDAMISRHLPFPDFCGEFDLRRNLLLFDSLRKLAQIRKHEMQRNIFPPIGTLRRKKKGLRGARSQNKQRNFVNGKGTHYKGCEKSPEDEASWRASEREDWSQRAKCKMILKGRAVERRSEKVSSGGRASGQRRRRRDKQMTDEQRVDLPRSPRSAHRLPRH